MKPVLAEPDSGDILGDLDDLSDEDNCIEKEDSSDLVCDKFFFLNCIKFLSSIWKYKLNSLTTSITNGIIGFNFS